jgi:hypothetical protein
MLSSFQGGVEFRKLTQRRGGRRGSFGIVIDDAMNTSFEQLFAEID